MTDTDDIPAQRPATVNLVHRVCSICSHEKLEAINHALKHPEGRSVRFISAEYGTSYDALWRHKRSCVLGIEKLAKADQDGVLIISLKQSMRKIKNLLDAVLRDEEINPRKIRAVTMLISELRMTIKQLGEMQAQRRPTNDAAQLQAQFQEFKQAVFAALESHADAKAAVIEKIKELVKA